jgi:enediyne biosynthesis protein E4
LSILIGGILKHALASVEIMHERRRCVGCQGLAVGLGVLLIGGLTSCGRPADDRVEGDGRPVRQVVRGHGEFGVTPPIPAGSMDLFEDVTELAGLEFVHQFCDQRLANIIQSSGSGVAILDYDGDGFMDIYFVNAGPLDGVTNHEPGTRREPNRLYRNRGDGTFEDVTKQAGVTGHGYGIAAVAGDFDNDGWPDLYVVNVGPNILYRNRGDGTFEEVTEQAGVGDTGTGIGAIWVDVDRDGWLDLFVANYLTFDPDYTLYFNPDAYPGPLAYNGEFNVLYRNRGDGTFEDISEQAGVRIPGHRGMSVAAFDYTGNGFPDLYVCNDMTPNLLLVNDGTGRFTDKALEAGVAFNAAGESAGSMTAAIGDVNGDLIPDILVARFGYGSLYIGGERGLFEDRLIGSGLAAMTAQYVGWGCNLLDFDNNGALDIFVANGDAHHMVGWESLLLKNAGDGTFTDARDQAGAYFDAKIRARGSVVLDFDNDGRLDLLVTAIADRPFLLRNRGEYGHNWIKLDLEGTRSNRDGFGSRITLTAEGRHWYAEAKCPAGFLSSSDPRVHFGLGTRQQIERIEIRWPSGTVQVLEHVPVNQILKVREPDQP